MRWSGGLALGAFLFFVLAGAIYEGYLSTAVVGGLGYVDFVIFGVLALVAAVAFYATEPHYGGWR